MIVKISIIKPQIKFCINAQNKIYLFIYLILARIIAPETLQFIYLPLTLEILQTTCTWNNSTE
jgi:hypothetical protein